MFCKRCITEIRAKDDDGVERVVGYRQGRVFLDQVFSEHSHVELFCIQCGKRWMIDKTKGAFGAWLDRKARSIT